MWGEPAVPSCRRERLEQRNWRKYAVVSRIHPLLTQHIRAIICRCCINWSFNKSEETFILYVLLEANDVRRIGLGTDSGVSIH